METKWLIIAPVWIYGGVIFIVCFYWLFICYRKKHSIPLAIIKTAMPLIMVVLFFLIGLVLI